MVCHSNLCILPSVHHTHSNRTRGRLKHQHWVQRQGLHRQISCHSSHNNRVVCSNLCILPSVHHTHHTHSNHTRGRLRHWRWGQIQLAPGGLPGPWLGKLRRREVSS